MTPAVGFGIAGWSYDDWRDVVYPRGCRDTLRFCARLVDFVEINSTFYQLPTARNSAAWVRRTADLPVRFTAKLPGEFTHRGVSDPAVAARVREGFAPLSESGRLTALLAQFDYRFTRSAESLGTLAWLRDEFGGTAPLVVEVRHRSWAAPAALAELGALGVGVANLDYPGAASGFGPRVTGVDAAGRLAYFRLHGRNPAWFDKEAGRDQVYDWEYSSGEVEDLAARTRAIAAAAGQTVVIANNHFQGKAMKLVLELLAAFRQRSVEVPEPMLRRYPALASIARRAQGELF